MTFKLRGMKLATSVGIPIPRLIYMPSLISCAMRFAIPVLSSMTGCFNYYITERLCALVFDASDRSLFDPFLVALASENPLNINSWRVNTIRIQFSCGDELFHFRNGNFSCGGHHGVKVSGSAPVQKISSSVALPRFYNGEICP